MTEPQEPQPTPDQRAHDPSFSHDSAQAAGPSQALAPDSNAPAAHVSSSASEALSQPEVSANEASGAAHQSAHASSAPHGVDPSQLREQIIQMLHTVYDPEIPVDIWELGLVYRLDVRDNGDVQIQMTLTSPMCPVAGSLPPEVRQKVASVPGVRNVEVELTWDPPWHMGMMSDVARLKLGFM